MNTSNSEDRGSQNPYAVLSLIDEDPAKPSKIRERPREMELPLTYGPIGHKGATVDYSAAPSVNPYAKLANCDEDPVDLFLRGKDSAMAPAVKERQIGISKKAFQDGCRRIFLPYVPPSEGNALRAHYREFISRNENKTPRYREYLLAELAKYDLSSSGNLTPHFNRGTEFFTAAKLMKIEEAAEKEL